MSMLSDVCTRIVKRGIIHCSIHPLPRIRFLLPKRRLLHLVVISSSVSLCLANKFDDRLVLISIAARANE